MKFIKQPHILTQRGFSLMEILVTSALMIILVTMSLAILNPIEQIKKSNDARRKSDLEQIQRALDLYYQDQGRYPQSTGGYNISAITPPTNNYQTYNWKSPWMPYINKLPADPTGGQTYVYYSPDPVGQTYYLYTSLQRGTVDPQSCNKGLACAKTPSPNACGKVCNFGLSSPNVSP